MRTWRPAPPQVGGREPGHLLPAAWRPPAALLMAVCAGVTVVIGGQVSHRSRPGWLDAAVDARTRASLGGHPHLLDLLARLGDPVPLTLMVAALALACLAARRWRGAVLVAVAVPAAAVLTELVLKPVIGRTLEGAPSFPSGHATGMFALAASLAVLLARLRLPTAARILIAAGAFLAATGTAAAMVGLGVHYFTDTVGGAAVGTGVVLAVTLLLDLAAGPRPRRR